MDSPNHHREADKSDSQRQRQIKKLSVAASLAKAGKLDEAKAAYEELARLRPEDHLIHGTLGAICGAQGNIIDSVQHLSKAIQLNPSVPEFHLNLGIALKQQGKLKASINSFNKAITLQPGHSDAQWNLAVATLQDSDYENGWIQYECRMTKKKNPTVPHAFPKCRPWDGKELGQSENLLLVSEQGLGDTIQFARYALELQRQGISVKLCAQKKLHSLIQASGIDFNPLTPEQGADFTNGAWLPLLSLPRHLGVSPKSPIITAPYINTTNYLLDKWKRVLSESPRPIIGINWQGNPTQEMHDSKGRSLPLETMAPLVSNGHISLVSLQKGYGAEQMEKCSFKNMFVKQQGLISETWDFLETAAVIANCDLIITSDTSIAHLAGSMGTRTWLLLKKVPEWRWGLEGASTFWYPSLRLFRQRVNGDWHEVMERVAEALQQHFHSDSTPATRQ